MTDTRDFALDEGAGGGNSDRLVLDLLPPPPPLLLLNGCKLIAFCRRLLRLLVTSSSAASSAFSPLLSRFESAFLSKLVVDPLKSDRNENRSVDIPCLCRLTDEDATEGGLGPDDASLAFLALGVDSTSGCAGLACSDAGATAAVRSDRGDPSLLRFFGVL